MLFHRMEENKMVSPITSVTDRVIQAIENDPRLKNAIIEVASDRGIVNLAGTVKSEDARRAAEELARQQPGVVTVINEIKVA